jgi:adenosylhomocysteine nucleosidase
MSKVGIIVAMEEEIAGFKKIMQIESIVEKASMQFLIGKIDKLDVVVVKCGIGKVNAAACTQIISDNFNVTKVISTGVAGGIGEGLQIGDVVISSDLIQHDVDVTAFGYKVGQIAQLDTYEFAADNELVEIAKKACENVKFDHKVVVGRIISGDQFISDAEKVKYFKEFFEAQAVEMESASIAHVCYLNKVPFLAIRAISDGAGDEAFLTYDEFVKVAAVNSCKIVSNILSEIQKKEL